VIPLADEAATQRVGTILATLVESGDTIALVGDLGAGKTTLVSALVAELGAGTASSPTFSLVNKYPGGRLVVWHVDLYRLERAAELPELGLDDIIGEPGSICVIEWADKFAVLPPDHLRLELAHAGAGDEHDARMLEASGTGPRGQALASALTAELLGSQP
jgi:tRNA threonylcarbamoyladenosine biosynthesis protein TsaE